MPGDGSELGEAGRLLALLLHAQHALEAVLEAEMRDRLGVATSQFDVLRALVEAPDGHLRMVDIADRMCISRSGVTQSVDRLETLGLVTRCTNRDDRRLVLAAITPAGRDLVRSGLEILEAVGTRCLTEQLTGRQVAALSAGLTRLVVTPAARSARAEPV